MAEQTNTGMPTRPETSGAGKNLLIAIIIIVVLGVGAFAIFGRGDEVADQQQGIAPGDDNAISVNDQNSDSVAVLVEQVSFIAPGFIDIHSDNNGQPGPIIATSNLYQPGTYRNVSVITPLTPGATYHAMLHGDDGNGVFTNAQADPPLTNKNGQIVNDMFKVNLANEGEEQKG